MIGNLSVKNSCLTSGEMSAFTSFTISTLPRSIKAMLMALEARDHYTGQHSIRVTQNALRFAHRLGLPQEDLEALGTVGHLHDIGKIGISDTILLKPGSFTLEERAIIKNHPLIGKKILAPLGLRPQEVNLILHHHERWDGQGYPCGLFQQEIPFLCQILSLADCYDAITSNRPYRNGRSIPEALEEIQASAGTQFNPELTQEFIEMISSTMHKKERLKRKQVLFFSQNKALGAGGLILNREGVSRGVKLWRHNYLSRKPRGYFHFFRRSQKSNYQALFKNLKHSLLNFNVLHITLVFFLGYLAAISRVSQYFS